MQSEKSSICRWLAQSKFEHAKNMFSGTCLKVTSAGKRHLGAVIGSQDYKNEYVNNLVTTWKEELETLSKIAEIQPQAAYSAYVHGFKGKFVYFLRTIPNINDHLQPIEEVIRNNLIPAITGGHQCSDEERKLLALPVRLGGLGIDDICKISTHEYESSRKVTKNLVDRVIKQEPKIKLHDEATKEVKNEIKKIRNDLYQQQLNEIKESLDESQKRQNEIIREPGCSAWLVTLPIGEYNYNLTKQEFWDAIRLRYNWAYSESAVTMCLWRKV